MARSTKAAPVASAAPVTLEAPPKRTKAKAEVAKREDKVVHAESLGSHNGVEVRLEVWESKAVREGEHPKYLMLIAGKRKACLGYYAEEVYPMLMALRSAGLAPALAACRKAGLSDF